MAKKIILTSLFFILVTAAFLFFSSFSAVKTFAAPPPCDPATRSQCTYCIDDGANGCRPDFNLSCKPDAGYFPDTTSCTQLHSGCNSGQAMGNCLAAPTCGNNGDSCTGTGSGTCCSGQNLLCTNGTCSTQATCKNLNEQCPGPAGAAGGCCGQLQCQVYAGGGSNLKCQNPPNPITGYLCDKTGQACLPCHNGDKGCNPPPYSDYSSCYSACTGDTTAPSAIATPVCDFAGDKKTDCNLCMGDGKHSWTAIGCVPADPKLFISQILGIGVGIGGGIAFLLILFGGFQILMSAGNPEKLNAGKELVTSAITGLLIIIFSLFILRLIGFNILGIPGFG